MGVSSPSFLSDPEQIDLTSIIDDLPFWSAPFGLRLLEAVRFKKGIRALDIGCGEGFPIVELAARFDDTSRFYGIDTWTHALERLNYKLAAYQIQSVAAVPAAAEYLPFSDHVFDLIVSNNGINNVTDIQQVLRECHRVSKPGAQVILTMNTEATMTEFYSIFERVLKESGQDHCIEKMNAQIFSKRKPVETMQRYFHDAGFQISHIVHDSFNLRFADGTTLFKHYLIKNWFLDGWKKIPDQHQVDAVFKTIETRLNLMAAAAGEISLTIPFVTIDGVRLASSG